ncbi:MAG: hypothetical protein OXP36_00340, partial [Gammaproteobacteria bacterium]|nr:hypothetical protein [Gammaproteobacteria bacterium]
MTSIFPKIDPGLMPVNWAPLVVKPFPYGPEAFVAAIAAHAQSGEMGCRSLLSPARIGALFGDRASLLGAVVDGSLASLRRHLRTRREFDGWSSPFEGVDLGEPTLTYVLSFTDVYAMAGKTCSIFGDAPWLPGCLAAYSNKKVSLSARLSWRG